MKKNELYVYTALSLATLVPVPGRLAYGIVIIVMLYLLSLLGILFKQFVSMFFEYGLRSVLIAAMLISTCLLVRQILIIISPITAFILGINIYVPALTAFILGNLYRHSGLKLSWKMYFIFYFCTFLFYHQRNNFIRNYFFALCFWTH